MFSNSEDWSGAFRTTFGGSCSDLAKPSFAASYYALIQLDGDRSCKFPLVPLFVERKGLVLGFVFLPPEIEIAREVPWCRLGLGTEDRKDVPKTLAKGIPKGRVNGNHAANLYYGKEDQPTRCPGVPLLESDCKLSLEFGPLLIQAWYQAVISSSELVPNSEIPVDKCEVGRLLRATTISEQREYHD